MMTREGQPEAEPRSASPQQPSTPSLRRRLLRPLLLLMVVGGLLFFAPRLTRHDVRFAIEVPSCARDVSLDLFRQGGARARAFRSPLTGSRQVEFVAPLLAGEYRAVVAFACTKGLPVEQAIQVEGESSFRIDGMGGCPCLAEQP